MNTKSDEELGETVQLSEASLVYVYFAHFCVMAILFACRDQISIANNESGIVRLSDFTRLFLFH